MSSGNVRYFPLDRQSGPLNPADLLRDIADNGRCGDGELVDVAVVQLYRRGSDNEWSVVVSTASKNVQQMACLMLKGMAIAEDAIGFDVGETEE